MADDDEGPALQVRRTRNPDTPRASDGLSGNPFGAPADNPFSSPSGGHAQPGSNPFASPSAGHAAPASNPFATSPAQSHPTGAPAQPVANPFATSGVDAPLELDRDPNAFRSSTGAHKAELDEWNRSLQTGEFNIAGDPITDPGTDRSKVITGEISRPEPAALKDPAVSAGPPTGGAAGPPAGRPARPAPAQREGGSSKLIPMVAGGVVLLAVVAVGGKVAYTKLNKPKADATVERRVETETDAFVRQMQAQGENAPDCWTTDDGYSFVYKDEAGERVRVGTIAEVPVLYRKASVCVPD